MSARRLRLVVSTLAATLVLAGCVTAPQVVGGAPGVDASRLAAWEAAGRLGVVAGSGGGSGSFLWRQNGERSAINMHGPVGIGGLEIDLENDALSIATSDGRVLESAAARAELARRLGADLPTRSLRYWMLGLAAPGAHEWLESDTGPVLLQDGWRIEYGEFAENGSVRVPVRLKATAGETRVRLVIDRWNLEP